MTASGDLGGIDGGVGVALDDAGATFSLESESATAVTLCLFERPGDRAASRRVALERAGRRLWRTRVEGVGAGQLYGYRVDGPFDPARGHRFDASKLLVDPRALRVVSVDGSGEPMPSPDLFSTPDARAGAQPSRVRRVDSAGAMPKCAVVDLRSPATGQPAARPPKPRTAWRDTVIYEAHVVAATARHPDVPAALRGTFGGLASDAFVDHLEHLGVTALELMPPCQIASEPHLWRLGRRNGWGYSTLAFLAPHAGYASAAGADPREVDPVAEFRAMVDRLHAAGIEVWMDLVPNHTAEGGLDGPTLSLRGVDHAGYYRLDRHGRPLDWTGCGNTLDVSRPLGRSLLLDCLRHWAGPMGVDGFRFDLAPSLGRGPDGAFDPNARLLREIADDPLLDGVKLVAEPWDLGPGGYRLGQFPPPFAEWNGRFRDGVRRFWLGAGNAADFATRVAGSEDLFAGSAERRGPLAGVSFVACHDGLPLYDVVAYDHKHNLENGEAGRDGSNGEVRRAVGAGGGGGVEGPSDDPAARETRDRLRRALLATVCLSAGVPMLTAGDELGRTQGGNNNAYSVPRDDPARWAIDWPSADLDQIEFVARLLALRRALPALRRDRFLRPEDVVWLDAQGREITDWQRPRAVLAMRLTGLARGEETAPEPEHVAQRTGAARPLGELLIAWNASNQAIDLPLPPGGRRLLDSSVPAAGAEAAASAERSAGVAETVPAHAVIVVAWPEG